MSRHLTAALLVVAMLAGTVAPLRAQEATPASGGYRAVDATGATITLNAPPERIVCYNYGCDAMLAELGLVPVGSWFSTWYDYTWTPYFGERGGEVVALDSGSVEEVAALEPDLIIDYVGFQGEALSDVAPVYVARDSTSGLDAQLQNLRDVGALTGTSDRAEAAISRLGAVVDAIVAAAPAGAADATAMVMASVPDVYYAGSPRLVFCELIDAERLGRCVPDTGDQFLGAGFGEVSAESVLDADPDVILYVTNDYALLPPGPDDRADAVWTQLSAVSAGRVVLDGSQGTLIPSVRALQYALELYAASAFPDVYASPGPWPAYDPDRPVTLRDDATPAASPVA